MQLSYFVRLQVRLGQLERIILENSNGKTIKLIDDAARAAGANYEDSKIGSKGWATVFSFHSAKSSLIMEPELIKF